MKHVWKSLQEYLFPAFCMMCNKEGEVMCERCLRAIKIAGMFDCPVCHRVSTKLCNACLDMSYIEQHIAMMPYQEDGVSGRIITQYKYAQVEALHEVFETLITTFFEREYALFSVIDIVVPVPLHPARFAERGFNQADMIAKQVGCVLGKPVKSLLKRTRNTPHQARLKRDERLENVVDAFELVGDVHDQTFLLVDDVFTTGSTIQACAKSLADGGAGSVYGFSVARG